MLSALLIFLAAVEGAAVAADKEDVKPGIPLGPRLAFSTDSVDFGRVPTGQIVAHSFDFINSGDAPLKIEDDPRAKGKLRLKVVKGC